MGAIIECITNPNCEMIEECESKIDCTVAMEASEGLTRYICGRTPCKYSKKSNFSTTNCNLTTCRYNENDKCTNDEKGKECVEVAEKVLVNRLSPSELLMHLSDSIGNTEVLKKFGIEIDFSKFEYDGE